VTSTNYEVPSYVISYVVLTRRFHLLQEKSTLLNTALVFKHTESEFFRQSEK